MRKRMAKNLKNKRATKFLKKRQKFPKFLIENK